MFLPIITELLLACRQPPEGTTPPPTSDTASPTTAETGSTTIESPRPTADTGPDMSWVHDVDQAAMRFVDLPWSTAVDVGVGQGAVLADTDLDGQLEVVLAGKTHLWVFEAVGQSGERTIDDASMQIEWLGGPSLSTADLNGDGHPDLFNVPPAIPSETKIEILFTPLSSGESATLIAPGTLIRPVAIDIDDDGFPDIIDAYGGNMQVFFGPFADGEVREPDRLLEWKGPETFDISVLRVMGDLTGNGSPDLVVCTGNRTHVWPGPIAREGPSRTEGVFRLVEGNAWSSYPHYIPARNAAGDAGILLSGDGSTGEFGVHIVPLPVTSSEWTEVATPTEDDGDNMLQVLSYSLMQDINSDGITDWAFGSYLSIYPGLGVALGPFKGHHPVPSNQLGLFLKSDDGIIQIVRTGDVDGNGVMDFLTRASNTTYLYMNPHMRTADEIPEP